MAGLYYLAHSTLVTAGLFLLIEPISRQRGELGGRLAPGPPIRPRHLLGWSFLIGAIAAVGIPPLSGFLGKMMILQSATGLPSAGWIYATLLLTGLLGLIGCSRAGNLVFWETAGQAGDRPVAAATAGALGPPLALIGCSVLLTAGAGPIVDYAQTAAQQVVDPTGYIRAVLDQALASGRSR